MDTEEGLTLLDIPSDVMVEIASYLKPSDVRAVAESTPRLLWVMEDTMIWKSQFQAVFPQGVSTDRRKAMAQSKHGWAAEMEWRVSSLPKVLCAFNKARSVAAAWNVLASSGLFGGVNLSSSFPKGPGSEAVYEFLFSTPGVSKRRIGQVLGAPEGTLARSVYVSRMALDGQSLWDALRTFLMPIRLPGEAQAIDRIMYSFAEAWVACNPEAAVDSEEDLEVLPNGFVREGITVNGVYVLAFAGIMLNTDMHSNHRVSGFSRESFIQNCSGMHLPRDMVSGLYEAITADPLIHDSEDAHATPLGSASVRIHNNGYIFPWKRRFLKLTYQKLLVFADEDSQDSMLMKFAHQALSVTRVGAADIVLECQDPEWTRLDGWSLDTSFFSRSDILTRYTSRTLRIRFDSPQEADTWVLVLNRGLNTSFSEDVWTSDPAAHITRPHSSAHSSTSSPQQAGPSSSPLS